MFYVITACLKSHKLKYVKLEFYFMGLVTWAVILRVEPKQRYML